LLSSKYWHAQLLTIELAVDDKKLKQASSQFEEEFEEEFVVGIEVVIGDNAFMESVVVLVLVTVTVIVCPSTMRMMDSKRRRLVIELRLGKCESD